ncbi:MAG: sugar transferase [Devosia sp.]|uniref:sugar transferase n=1 Tax=Devosia sp. TaxID=1871048 RepID=UPI001AC86520|nr:sugar transferase [Devosia sp.]MBN9317459.1 sugar transferase [Devosia sp.]
MSISSFPGAGNFSRRSRSGGGDQHGLRVVYRNGLPVPPSRTVKSALRDAAKRCIDVVVSGTALIALAPVLALLAATVAISSPGPVLFSQWRIGRNGQKFRIYKFRTIRIDAADESGVRQVIANDPGVTRVGAFMRAKSLDELPQLFNVLRGDMSLIGPRPHPVGMKAAGIPYEELVPYYDMRHSVRPGLSGWAQANGFRGPTLDADAARSRIEHDVAYIQNQSIWLDVKIVVLTLKHEFLSGSGV